MFGAYNFIDWYFEHIRKDTKTAEAFRAAKDKNQYKMPNYKYGSIISYALSPNDMKNIKETDEPVDLFKMDIYNKVLSETLKSHADTNNAINECDEWLKKIGFYNDNEESFWKYAIKIGNVIRYNHPVALSCFIDQNGEAIKSPPQSFIYTKTEIINKE